jgi:hypothetical protein
MKINADSAQIQNSQPVLLARATNALSPSSLWNRFDRVALNPQPLPPKDLGGAFSNPFDSVALNPQPLPPRSQLAILASHLSALY